MADQNIKIKTAEIEGQQALQFHFNQNIFNSYPGKTCQSMSVQDLKDNADKIIVERFNYDNEHGSGYSYRHYMPTTEWEDF